MIPGLLIVLAIAIVDWIAVARGWKKVEYAAKPLTMLALFLVLTLVGRLSSLPLILFGLGILFSLAGDVFLMLSERRFIAGLVAFLLAHLAYIVGFNLPLPQAPLVWTLGLAIILSLGAARILRRIVSGLAASGTHRLIRPVVLYGMVITVMLLSAMLTLLRLDWQPLAAVLVSLGAFLFYLSDIILAWNKFVNPIKNGRMMNIVSYHLGQMALVAGVILQLTG